MNSARTRAFRVGIGVGVALAIVGVGTYVAIEDAHWTALIPAAFGVVFVLLGRLGLETGRDREALYGMGLLALLGVAGSSRAFGDLVALATGGGVDSPAAVGSQGLMIALCLVVLVLVGSAVGETRAEGAR